MRVLHSIATVKIADGWKLRGYTMLPEVCSEGDGTAAKL